MTSPWRLKRDIDDAEARQRLHARLARLLRKWEPVLGVHLNEWGIRKMKTYWASTDSENCRITFAEKLGEMSPAFVEVTVVHELVHCRTDGHDAEFYRLMDKHVPNWRRLHAKYNEPLTQHS